MTTPAKCLRDEPAETSPAHALAHLISDISEATYAAGWLDGIEYDLWRLIHGADDDEVAYGMGTISPGELRQLRDLSEQAGGWVSWFDDLDGLTESEEWGTRFVPFDQWLVRLEQRTKRDREVFESMRPRALENAFTEDHTRHSSLFPAAAAATEDTPPTFDDPDEERRRVAVLAAFADTDPAPMPAADISTPDTGSSYDGGGYDGGGGDCGGGGASGDW